jgi:hypothetical protein
MTETYIEGKEMYIFFVLVIIIFVGLYLYMTNPSLPKFHSPPYKDYNDFCYNLDFQASNGGILNQIDECVTNCTNLKNCDLERGGWL